jgi:hypothetical protein
LVGHAERGDSALDSVVEGVRRTEWFYSLAVGSVAGYAAQPPSGSVTVAGAEASEAITFVSSSTATYAVTFGETGLPSATLWSVTLNGVLRDSSGASIYFVIPNGTYSSSVGAIDGDWAAPSSGSVTVAGSAGTQSITFSAIGGATYAVTFTESGLPYGSSWGVTLDGV